MNIANDKAQVRNPHPSVSIFNFHYASPPSTVFMNYGLNKVIGDNETGFKGTDRTHYRIEGWEFIIAGGALYNNLDYSFVAGQEDGTFAYPLKQPGAGDPVLRKQLKALTQFIHGFDFIHMKPDNTIFQGGIPQGATARALVETGKSYAIYIQGGQKANLKVSLPGGKYALTWLNTRTGEIEKNENVNLPGGTTVIASPDYQEDIALGIKRIGKAPRKSKKIEAKTEKSTVSKVKTKPAKTGNR